MKYPLILGLLLSSTVFAGTINKNVNVDVNDDNGHFEGTVTITTTDDRGKTSVIEEKVHSQKELDKILLNNGLNQDDAITISAENIHFDNMKDVASLIKKSNGDLKFLQKQPNGSFLGSIFIDIEKKPLIGVVLGKNKNKIVLETVSPGSPAAEAGMQSGDQITSIQHNEISQSANLKEALEMIGQPEDGQVVAFGVLRDGKKLKFEPKARIIPLENLSSIGGDNDFQVKVVTGDLHMLTDNNSESINIDLGDLKGLGAHAFSWPSDTNAPLADMLFGNQLGQMNLVKLNPELGKYFATNSGILIVKIEKDNQLGLNSGDVIKSIDGREVKSPSHMMRILKSYNSGDKFSIKIYRNKHKKTLKSVMPEEGKLGALFGSPEQNIEIMLAEQNN